MEVSEKKLGCLEGTKRTNMDNCGYVEGSVNESLKSGMKQVCVKDGKAIFWIVNDYDVTVTADDVKSYTIDGINVFTREYSRNNKSTNDQRVFFHEHTVNYLIEFKNGKSGVLKVNSLVVYARDKSYEANNKYFFQNKIVHADYAAEVKGWLTPDGKQDERYNDAVCPEGYKPDIIGFRKISSTRPCEQLCKALNLPPLFNKTVECFGKQVPFIRVAK